MAITFEGYERRINQINKALNEKYEDKLKTYFSGPNYAKTLCKDFYHSNPDFIDFNNNLEKQTGQKFVHYDSFTPESMEERCKLLYELVKIIWDI